MVDDVLSFLSWLVTWQTALLSFGVYVIVFCFRRVIQTILKSRKLESTIWWRELALPVLPPAVGLFFGLFADNFPFPEGMEAMSSRVLYSVACGFISSWVYKAAKKLYGRVLVK